MEERGQGKEGGKGHVKYLKDNPIAVTMTTKMLLRRQLTAPLFSDKTIVMVILRPPHPPLPHRPPPPPPPPPLPPPPSPLPPPPPSLSPPHHPPSPPPPLLLLPLLLYNLHLITTTLKLVFQNFSSSMHAAAPSRASVELFAMSIKHFLHPVGSDPAHSNQDRSSNAPVASGTVFIKAPPSFSRTHILAT
eukprot:608525-Hanusia_phi.AAC.3